jgi:hypothetical protein
LREVDETGVATFIRRLKNTIRLTLDHGTVVNVNGSVIGRTLDADDSRVGTGNLDKVVQLTVNVDGGRLTCIDENQSGCIRGRCGDDHFGICVNVDGRVNIGLGLVDHNSSGVYGVRIGLEQCVLKVDGNFAIAWSDSLNFTVERSGKTLVGSAASGEGFVNVYRGTGKVLLAPVDRTIGGFTNPATPTSGGSKTASALGSIIGGIAGAID